MRALAEFAMRGRMQAVAVTVACILMPVLFASGVAAAGSAAPGAAALVAMLMPVVLWFGVATVALVALRQGGVDAFVVLGWGLLATFAGELWQGDIGPAAALLAATAGAFMLRWTSAWPLALVALMVVGLVAALILNVFGSAYVDQLVALLNQVLAPMRQQMAEQGGVFNALNAVQVSGWLGFWAAVSGFASLALARWWQAQLYNPNGFGREFRQLRLPPQVALALLVVGAALILPGPDYRIWLALPGMPFVIAGVALVHGMAALKQWGRGPLVAMYVAWVLLSGPITATLFLLALIDSWADFRGRYLANAR